MRIRHLGFLNRYARANTRLYGPDSIDEATESSMAMSLDSLLLWHWRVSAWRVQGGLSWSDVYLPDNAGSGSFDIIMPADGPLQFEGQREGTEMDLLHRLYLEVTLNGQTGSGDLGGFGMTFSLGRTGIVRYRDRRWVPTYSVTLVGDNVGFVVDNPPPDSLRYGTMSPEGIFNLTLGDNPDILAGSVQWEPHSWYPYQDDAEVPIYAPDGSALIDPRIDTPADSSE